MIDLVAPFYPYTRMRPALLLVVLMLFVAGCGKKGNLYLPDPPAAPQNIQPAAR